MNISMNNTKPLMEKSKWSETKTFKVRSYKNQNDKLIHVINNGNGHYTVLKENPISIFLDSELLSINELWDKYKIKPLTPSERLNRIAIPDNGNWIKKANKRKKYKYFYKIKFNTQIKLYSILKKLKTFFKAV